MTACTRWAYMVAPTFGSVCTPPERSTVRYVINIWGHNFGTLPHEIQFPERRNSKKYVYGSASAVQRDAPVVCRHCGRLVAEKFSASRCL